MYSICGAVLISLVILSSGSVKVFETLSKENPIKKAVKRRLRLSSESSYEDENVELNANGRDKNTNC